MPSIRSTHFGPDGRPRGKQIRPDPDLMARFSANPLLADVVSVTMERFATQGDGITSRSSAS
jgi:tRNA-splicing ligase RtcB (3'-phosphate/5'-hydroxy nucleic acid ligase)